jgi:uncharacterized protein (TIGR03435 family)
MTRLRVVEIVALACVLVTPAVMGQAPTFEVASVKLNKSGVPQSGPQLQLGGRVTLINRTLRYLVQFAYSSLETPLHDPQIVGGPDWADDDRFDITAKMEGDPPPLPATANLARVMMRSVLTDRFQLKVRSELRDLPVYELVLARQDRKLGPGLRARLDTCERPVPQFKEPDLRGDTPLCGLLRGGRGTLNYRGVPISSLLRPSALGGLDRIVIDQTRLRGIFDIDLTWAADTAASADAASMFTAVQEQLGLRLRPTRAPVEVLVIESAQRPLPD